MEAPARRADDAISRKEISQTSMKGVGRTDVPPTLTIRNLETALEHAERFIRDLQARTTTVQGGEDYEKLRKRCSAVEQRLLLEQAESAKRETRMKELEAALGKHEKVLQQVTERIRHIIKEDAWLLSPSSPTPRQSITSSSPGGFLDGGWRTLLDSLEKVRESAVEYHKKEAAMKMLTELQLQQQHLVTAKGQLTTIEQDKARLEKALLDAEASKSEVQAELTRTHNALTLQGEQHKQEIAALMLAGTPHDSFANRVNEHLDTSDRQSVKRCLSPMFGSDIVTTAEEEVEVPEAPATKSPTPRIDDLYTGPKEKAPPKKAAEKRTSRKRTKNL